MSGAARALHWKNQLVLPLPKGIGKPLKLFRVRDRELQLFPLNEEFLVSVSHQLTLITSLPFVHTARRYPELSCFERSADCLDGTHVLPWRKAAQSQWLEPGKSRNKVAVGEPAAGSLSRTQVQRFMVLSQ
jgi:hypothetical protein